MSHSATVVPEMWYLLRDSIMVQSHTAKQVLMAVLSLPGRDSQFKHRKTWLFLVQKGKDERPCRGLGNGKMGILVCGVKSTAGAKRPVTVNTCQCNERVGEKECNCDLWNSASRRAAIVLHRSTCAAPSWRCLFSVGLRVIRSITSHSGSSSSRATSLSTVSSLRATSPTSCRASTHDAQSWCSQAGADRIETSAEPGANVESLLQSAIKQFIPGRDKR
jgi:hypothetical protein